LVTIPTKRPRAAILASHCMESMQVDEHYDIITIGSGGGAKVSTPAANLGLKVAMVEHGFDVKTSGEHRSGLGGTCLNRGCIPSKMLIHPADVVTELQEASRFGIQAEFKGIDFSFLVNHTSSSVNKDSDGIWKGYHENNKLTDTKHLYTGTAKFIGPKILKIEGSKGQEAQGLTGSGQGDKIISADYIFIAAGAEPLVPHIDGLEDTPYLTSTEALRLTEQPKKVMVIGGGYIATELGHMYGGLGSEVHMFARSELLRAMDKDAKAEFARVFTERYNVHLGIKFEKVSFNKETSMFSMTYTEGGGPSTTMEADQLLLCAGVTAVAGKMGLEHTGVEHSRGFIKVDRHLKTQVPGVFAFGDIAGNYLFRHCANYEGEYLLENVIYPLAHAKGLLPAEKVAWLPPAVAAAVEGKGGTVDAFMGALTYDEIEYNDGTTRPQGCGSMPWAVFSNPQVAGVGASEDQLEAQGMKEGVDYVKGLNEYKSSAMGDARMSDNGFAKVLICTKTRAVLGSVIVGYEASTMIHQVVPVFTQGGKLDDLLYMIHIHPALNEILRNACRKARNALVEGGFEVPLKLRLK